VDYPQEGWDDHQAVKFGVYEKKRTRGGVDRGGIDGEGAGRALCGDQ